MDSAAKKRFVPTTEGFYDTALNEGRCTNSEVMILPKFAV